MNYRIILAGLALAIIAALTWQVAPLLFSNSTHRDQSTQTKPVKVGEQAPDFILQSAEGPLQLSQMNGGKVLFFGFSHCPDVCPTGLATFSAAWNALPEHQRRQLQGIFISLDPERDSPERLAEYTRWFNANIKGATASSEQIDQLAKAYGVFYRRVELPNSSLGYSIDHSADYYLIDSDNHLQARVSHGSPVTTLSEALATLVTKQKINNKPATH